MVKYDTAGILILGFPDFRIYFLIFFSQGRPEFLILKVLCFACLLGFLLFVCGGFLPFFFRFVTSFSFCFFPVMIFQTHFYCVLFHKGRGECMRVLKTDFIFNYISLSSFS